MMEHPIIIQMNIAHYGAMHTGNISARSAKDGRNKEKQVVEAGRHPPPLVFGLD